jgi:hypothetical protein
MTTRARFLIAAMRAFVLLLGAGSLWLARDGMNPDGVSYLDASDVYLSGSWASGTGYWSPLYPMLLAAARFVGGQSAVRELVIAQSVNLVVFLLAFAALEYLIREVQRTTVARRPGPPTPNDTIWLALVYALFALTTVRWTRVWLVTPDMCVLVIVLVVGGLCVRLTSGRGGWPSVVVLGVMLALGYLAKAAMFPIAFVVLATLAIERRRSGRLRQAIVAGAVFLVVAAPQVAYATRLKGSLTFGDVGRLNYLWYVAGVPGPVTSDLPLPSRLPSPAATGQTVVPLDSARDAHPAIYDIDAPVAGTLPIWYDAGYWFRGVTAPLLPLALVRAVVRHARAYVELFGFLLAGGLAAMLAVRLSRRELGAVRPVAVVLVPSLAALVMYALVLVQSRYVSPFALLSLAALVPPWATDAVSRRLRIGILVGAALAMPLVVSYARFDGSFWHGAARDRANLVEALAARGIGPGARIGFIGEAYDAMWARPARVRFVSLVPRPEAGRFWALDEAGRASVLAHMRQRGARTIIAERPAPGVRIEGWEPLPSAGPPARELIVYGGPR